MSCTGPTVSGVLTSFERVFFYISTRFSSTNPPIPTWKKRTMRLSGYTVTYSCGCSYRLRIWNHNHLPSLQLTIVYKVTCAIFFAPCACSISFFLYISQVEDIVKQSFPKLFPKVLTAGLVRLATAGNDTSQICRTAGIQDTLGQGKPPRWKWQVDLEESLMDSMAWWLSWFLWRCFSFLGERDSNWDSNENIHPLYTNYKCVFLRHTRDPSMTCMPSFINHGHYRFSYPEILKNLKLITCVEGTLNQPSQTAALLYGWNNGNESENCVIAWSCIKCQGSKPFKIRAAWL